MMHAGDSDCVLDVGDPGLEARAVEQANVHGDPGLLRELEVVAPSAPA
jgi:hypothetical protein